MTDPPGELVLEVEPVELPPPAPVPSRAPPLALRAAVSVSLLVGLFVVAFGLVLGLLALNVLVIRAGFQVVALGLFTLLVVLSVGRGLVAMVRKPPEPQDEVEVPVAAEPELHTRLSDLARKVGSRPPDRVVVVADVNAYVREFGPLMGLLRGRRTLGIGAPLLDVLTVAQLDAVLAHELGHLAGGDTRLGPLAFRTDEAARQMIASLEQRALAWVFIAYWRFQHRVSAAVRRGQELVADRAAVQAAGRQAAADALHRVAVVSAAEDLYRQAFLGPLVEAGCRPADVGAGLREVLREPHHVRELSTLTLSADEGADPWATHPPTAARIARVAALPDPPGL
ncbi:MAG: M48 family metalloprotease, partial [Actinomycetes bacterium]